MPQSYRSSSVYSDGHSDSFSSTSSQWSTTYRKLPKKQKQSLSLRFLSWAAGAPPGATVVKKRVREIPDDRSDMSGWTNHSYWSQPETQMYWVVTPDDRHYYSGSSSSSRSSSGHGGRRSRSGRKAGGGSPQNHFNGAVPNPMPPPPPGFGPPMDGNFGPPPIPSPGFVPPFVGGGGYPPPPPPPPPPPQPAAPGGAPAFFDVSGQHQPGNPFHNGGGPPPGGFHPDDGDYDEEYDSDSTE